jgi:succinate dehydrogenase/fumarate reductase flavoprotein subunit
MRARLHNPPRPVHGERVGERGGHQLGRNEMNLLVIGGGMAGLAAAVAAVDAGATVTVVEKSARLGGSAAMSAGIVWTAPDFKTLREVVPGGDPALGQALIDGFWPAVDRIKSTGVSVSERWEGQMGFGSAVRVDIPALLEAWQKRIAAKGGRIVVRAAAREPLTDAAGRVCGAAVDIDGGRRELSADAVLLATGGFQGDPELMATFIGPGADTVLVRSNPGSVGDGFRLGRAAGAAASRCLSGFYGHLVPSPMRELRQDQYLRLTQYYSNHCILVNRLGRRFTDESLGDEVSNQATLRQPGSKAVLICDERIHTTFAATAPYPHGQVIDRIAEAEAAGGRCLSARTLKELVDAVAGWGVAPHSLTATLDQCAAAAAGDESALDEPRAMPPEPFVEAPFHALEVQPTVTFTFGGLAVDPDGRVLDRDAAPVPGLFAAGGDAGGLQDYRYVGGLALGLVFGPRAAEAAIRLTGARHAEAATNG